MSVSLRGVVMRLCPGLRLSSSICISSCEIGTRGGHPSITHPTPPPWLSPNVVTRKSVPKLFAEQRACTDDRREPDDDGARRPARPADNNDEETRQKLKSLLNKLSEKNFENIFAQMKALMEPFVPPVPRLPVYVSR